MTIDIPNNGRVVKNRQDVKVKSTHIELFERLAMTPPTDVSTLKKSLLVLTTPRSGSTMFCEALNSTNELGWCEEWFNYEYFAAYLIVNKIELFNLKDYMKWVAERSIRNGVYCLKWHVGQVESMRNDFGVDFNSMHFDRVIWLYRRDRLAQAVSLAKATVSDKFRSYEPGNGRDGSEAGHFEVLSSLLTLESQYLYFERHINSADVMIAYEDVCDFNHPVYADTMEAMGRQPVTPVAIRTKKQRNESSQEITHNFRIYLQQLMEKNNADN